MNINQSPFYNRGPVREPAHFFGRRGEVRKLVQAIGADIPQTASIIGERRIGKTSLLNYLSAPGGALAEFPQFLSRLPADYLFVRADLSALKTRELNGPLFFFRLLFKSLDKAFQDKTGQTFPIFDKYWESESVAELVEFGLKSYLDEIQQIAPNLAIIFLLDEADPLIRQGVGGLLRSLIQDHPISFVIATRLPLIEIDPEREVSPLFNILAETIPLGLMPQSEVHQMLTELSSDNFTPLELDFILKTGGLHPDFTQVAAHRVWESKQTGQDFAPDIVFPQIAADLKSACQGLWDGMTEGEQGLCVKMMSEGKVESDGAAQVLKRKGVLNEQNAFFSPVFSAFIGQKSALTAAAPQSLRFGDGYVAYGDFVAKLSPIEQKLLQYLYDHAGQVCSREEIHMAVWGEAYTENDAVKVNITVQRMKQKLGQLSELVEAVRGVGYRWIEKLTFLAGI